MIEAGLLAPTNDLPKSVTVAGAAALDKAFNALSTSPAPSEIINEELNRQEEFWNSFQYTFDTDELEFLRHAPLAPVIPCGSAFHLAVYWADGDGGTPHTSQRLRLQAGASLSRRPTINRSFSSPRPSRCARC